MLVPAVDIDVLLSLAVNLLDWALLTMIIFPGMRVAGVILLWIAELVSEIW